MKPIGQVPTALSVALAIAVGLGAAPARADMMAACSPEIAKYCTGVSEGRGRIAACLVSNDDKLGTACKPEVQSMAQQSSRNLLVPSWVSDMLVSRAPAALPASCTADAARNCAGVQPGDSRVFACLYARNSQVSKACSSDAEQEMKQLN